MVEVRVMAAGPVDRSRVYQPQGMVGVVEAVDAQRALILRVHQAARAVADL